jgi:hypothetical protein
LFTTTLLLRLHDEVRRHDLDAVGVELVLDVRMQLRKDLDALEWTVDVGVELVFDVVVLQRLLHDEGLGLRAQARNMLCGVDQHRVDLAPGRVVADGHRRRDQRPALTEAAPV